MKLETKIKKNDLPFFLLKILTFSPQRVVPLAHVPRSELNRRVMVVVLCILYKLSSRTCNIQKFFFSRGFPRRKYSVSENSTPRAIFHFRKVKAQMNITRCLFCVLRVRWIIELDRMTARWSVYYTTLSIVEFLTLIDFVSQWRVIRCTVGEPRKNKVF